MPPAHRRLARVLPVAALAATVVGWAIAGPARVAAYDRAGGVAASWHRGDWPAASVKSIAPRVLDLALEAASCASLAGLVTDPPTLTVIDYSRPSTSKRLWVFELATGRLLHEALVAHGQGSGDDLATRFSNEPNSHQSSLGLFVTADTYVGKNGYSLRLDGLEPGVNDRARERAIVMHGAPYVSQTFARANGRLGRSWGCPALPEAVARPLIDEVKGGSLVFAYYPDSAWLNGSRFLGGCRGQVLDRSLGRP
ncbi:MAG: murein L,D-transpeptidase catalytic domain family protein [Vicinamibacterales bacterium]